MSNPSISTTLTKWCGWFGAVLLALYLVTSLRAGPTPTELLLVTQPVLRLPLDAGEDITVVFRVPQWGEFREKWGDPSYIAFAFGSDRNIKPFSELGLTIEASVRGQTLPLTAVTNPPYSYSSETRDFGLAFRADPGDEVRLHVEASAQTPREGELVIQPQWPGSMKDRIVAAGLEQSSRPYLSLAGILGLTLVLVALLLCRGLPG